MSNTLELIKVSLKENLDLRQMKKDEGKTITFGVFMLLMGLLFTFLSVVYNFMFAFMFFEFELQIINSTIMMAGFGGLLILTTSIGNVKAIFTGKDYEVLASMPLTKRQIITAKILSFYITEFIFSAIIMIPNIVINTILWADISFIPVGIIIMIMLPIFPIVIACLVGIFISFFAERSKFGNVITTVLYMLFFVAVLGMTILFQTNVENDATSILGLTKMFKMFNPTSFLLEIAYTKSFIFFGLYCVVNILLLIGIILFIAFSYTRLHDLIESTKSNVKYERKKLESKGQFRSIVGLEFKRLFSSKVYFLNSSIGALLVIIMGAMFIYSYNDSKEQIGDVSMYLHFISILSMLILGIQSPAACSINMEGKNFWIIKSLPIDYRAYAKAKIFVSTIILAVGSIISSIMFIAFLNTDLIQSIGILVIPLLFVFIVSAVDFTINLYFYKLNYKNEQEAVKNSASVLISMLAGVVLTIIVSLPLVLLTFINGSLAILVTIIFMLLVAFVMYLVNMKIIVRRISAIEQ